MRSNVVRWIAVAVVALPLVACSSTVRRPQWLHPGPAWFQQNNATQYDPYPPNDVGPEIVGGRPLDFQKPPDEITRARQQLPLGPWRAGPRY